ncbi:MAG: hypothetical protein AMS21_00685 [Gemmatimonas sp. SG8_38_2]|nr:MAG: hypothetical protein AMS21_00685 [Gemmatimonas sp. SG8_38_2]
MDQLISVEYYDTTRSENAFATPNAYVYFRDGVEAVGVGSSKGSEAMLGILRRVALIMVSILDAAGEDGGATLHIGEGINGTYATCVGGFRPRYGSVEDVRGKLKRLGLRAKAKLDAMIA